MIEHQPEIDALTAALRDYVQNPNLLNYDIDSACIILGRAVNVLQGKRT
jgi:hypothetical protein